jgi:hypothetical protein
LGKGEESATRFCMADLAGRKCSLRVQALRGTAGGCAGAGQADRAGAAQTRLPFTITGVRMTCRWGAFSLPDFRVRSRPVL